jgi:hypothetical protein
MTALCEVCGLADAECEGHIEKSYEYAQAREAALTRALAERDEARKERDLARDVMNGDQLTALDWIFAIEEDCIRDIALARQWSARWKRAARMLYVQRETAESAMRSLWDYQDAVQADLKSRGEVSTVTMHKLLEAARLRGLALADQPLALCECTGPCDWPEGCPYDAIPTTSKEGA